LPKKNQVEQKKLEKYGLENPKYGKL